MQSKIDVNPSAILSDRLLLCLSVLVFVITFSSDRYSGLAVAVFNMEMIFLALYLFMLKEFPPIKKIIKSNPVSSTLFLLWFLSSTYSFLSSPYDLVHEAIAVDRFKQTLAHLLFFIILWDYLSRYKSTTDGLFLSIVLSTLVVIFVFSLGWSEMLEQLSLGNERYWFIRPPFNSHIRHTGYQAVAALTIVFGFFFATNPQRITRIFEFSLIVILWAFVFWLGGRGAVLSAIGAFFLICATMYLKKIPTRYFASAVSVSFCLGLILSEFLSVLPWNGILVHVQRSMDADSLNALSTSRIHIWGAVWESVKDNLMFGLGAQGYQIMPNHTGESVQPHSIFSQFLAEWGFVGGLLFASLLIKGFWAGLKLHVLNNRKSIDPSALIAGGVIVTLTLHSITDGTYFHAIPSLYLVIAFAVWITPSRKEHFSVDNEIKTT